MSEEHNNPFLNNTLLNRPLVFIGLMGAGKTTIGKRLAEYLDIPFIDSDREIEITAGCSIADIFEQYGEAEFRRVENQVILRLIRQAPLVLATGGGAFMHPETRQLLKEKTTTIWLNCDLETIFERISKQTHRPLLNVENPKETLSALMNQRYPVYAEADITLHCQNNDIETTVSQLVSTLEKQP